MSGFRSVSNYLWKLRDANQREITMLMQKFGLTEITARLLASRKIDIEQVESFLEPKIKNLMPYPFVLKDMEKASQRICEAIIKSEKIAIYGDYDVDGATSSSLLKRFFQQVGAESQIYIPDRITEGYGPNVKAFAKLINSGVKVIITVDCGTMAFEAVEFAQSKKIDVIILDHHIGGETLPNAFAIVNPNRLDESGELRYLAAVGVSFVFAVAVNMKLREGNYYKDRPEPNLINLLDLVALGTVCDVVPLHGINRAFVSQGLKILAKRANQGLAALSDVTKVDSFPSTYHLGYVLGPRINAGGRVGTSGLGSKLLAMDDYDLAIEIARELDQFNIERRAIEQQVYSEALDMAVMCDKSMIIIHSDKWHPGVVGIVAGRLKEKFNKPVAVLSTDGAYSKASCRSIKGFDLGGAVVSAKSAGIIENGGGHQMAAGFSILTDRIQEIIEFFENNYSEQIKKLSNEMVRQFDAYITLGGVNADLLSELDKLSPYGSENHEPKFLIKNIAAAKYNFFGEGHISCLLGVHNAPDRLVKATAYRAGGSKIETHITSGHKFDAICYVRANNWMGYKRVELVIDDVISV